ncbi:MAG: GNAT family N-acetyltransferase [Patescibacteria group bacterium]
MDFIELIQMKMVDAGKMLEWKNYPETREFAIVNHEKVKLKDHLKWLKKNIKYFKIILCDGITCGAIRIQNKEVSIWIDRACRGNGIATRTIQIVSRSGFTAKIVEGNIASMKCFIKCGYLPVSHQDGYYIFKK